jgi:hypothetical protein
MKKNISHIIVSVLCVTLIFNKVLAQSVTKSDPNAIAISVYIPNEIKVPDEAKGLLSNKLSQIISQNGVTGSSSNERFIITANAVIMNKDVLATAPPMTALFLQITFFIGDGVEGKIFSTKTIDAKGVGTNENKAFMEAIKTINPSNPQLASFIDDAKTKILSYFETQCDNIIKEVNVMAGLYKYDEAIYNLIKVPPAANACYEKTKNALQNIFKAKIERDCKIKLNEANSIWSKGQDMDAANSAASILSTVDPNSNCFGDVKSLFSKIEKRVLELNNREWAYKLKTQEQTSELIKAYRDVGVAYGNGQPKSMVYNIMGWWPKQ